jgi:hypothetical protein
MLWNKREMWTYVRVKVLASVKKFMVFWAVTPFGLESRYQRFAETFCLFYDCSSASPHATTNHKNINNMKVSFWEIRRQW